MLEDDIVVNGLPALFTLELVTELGEGWKGSQYIGEFANLEDLNKAINAIEVPLYWELKISFGDVDEA